MERIATLDQIEQQEFLERERRIENRRLKQRAMLADDRAKTAERQLQIERERHTAEMRLTLGGGAVIGCLLAAVTCFIAAPWWTAAAPVVLAWLILGRLGW